MELPCSLEEEKISKQINIKELQITVSVDKEVIRALGKKLTGHPILD